MQEDFRLIVDLVLVLAAATAGGLLASLLRQPVLLGYLLGGMVVGPAGLGLIKEVIQVETLAQFGVAFLLFALGVEFSFAELKKVKAIGLGGAALQIILTILVTVFICWATGRWGTLPAKGVFLGAILSLSSTAVVLKCLIERNETETTHGQVMLGMLVVQDLALGLMLAVLPALDKPPEEIGKAVFLALVWIVLFAAGAVAAGVWLIPPILRFLARTESQELFLLGVVALCLGIALLTEHLGLSIEMGAFVAGLMISEVEYADQTLTYVEPVRDIFATLFFASIGMLIDPVFLWNNLEMILGLVALVFLGKFLIITPIVRLFRYSWKTALIAGLGLAQIGEFSFVLASEGQALGLVSRQIYLLILGTTACTLILTPFVLRLVPQLLELPWLKRSIEASDLPLAVAADLPRQNHIVVCGYGRVGRNLVRLLHESGFSVVVVDRSESKIQQLREAGLPYVYGNAASLHVLETAGVSQAKGMAIALPDAMSTRLCLKRALELAPELDIVVRAIKDKDIELLYQLGAKEVVQPEFEASLELVTPLLTRLGMSSFAIEQKVKEIRNHHYLELQPQRSASQVSRELQMATQDMSRRWYNLPDASPLTGMSLQEADLRNLTGVSLMAIRRSGGEEVDYPSNATTLEEGDRLLVIGEADELAAFDALAKGEVAVPNQNAACQWMVVPESSDFVGKTLAELDIRRQYGISVQAIRRDGKFVRFPGGETQIHPGDRLLTCGAYYLLKPLKQALTRENQPPVTLIPVMKPTETQSVQEFFPMDRRD
ncbi:MAG TPA: cation:proton antiporter [Leptolyngbyaceae cyanobacterium]